MTDERNPTAEKQENLELNRETLQDLTELEAEAAQGGFVNARVAVASEGGCTSPLL
jgi:hypothetical protein